MRTLTLALAANLAGCIAPSVERCPVSGCPDEGLVFERPTIMLAIAADCSAKALPLPDAHQKYVVKRHGWLGDATISVSLADGWNLTELNTSTDQAQMLSALTNAIAAARSSATTTVSGVYHATSAPVCKPGIYKPDLDHMKLIGPLN